MNSTTMADLVGIDRREQVKGMNGSNSVYKRSMSRNNV